MQRRHRRKKQPAFLQRIRHFDPAVHGQGYLRILSWASLVVALVIFFMGIWIGRSFDQLQQAMQGQGKQRASEVELAGHLTEIQTGLQNLRMQLDDQRLSDPSVADPSFLGPWLQSQKIDTEALQATLDAAIQAKNSAQVQSTTQEASIQAALQEIQSLLAAAFFALVLLIILLGLNSALITWRDSQAKRELASMRDEWHEKGIQTGILETTRALDHDPSVLRNMMSWMYNYSNGNGDVEAAFDLFTQLMSRFSTLDFHPVGEIGEQVQFDPRKHRYTEVNINPGDICYIHETGWMLNDQVVREPLVMRSEL